MHNAAMNGLAPSWLVAGGRAPLRASRVLALSCALVAAPFAAFAAAPADVPALSCAAGDMGMVVGSHAGPGTRFGVAIGMTAATPAKPVEGWILARCNAEQVFFTRSESVHKDFMTALASHVGLDSWTDEQAFEAQVLRTLDLNQPPGQHLKNVSVQPSTIDGRPCVDVLRIGTVDPLRGPDGKASPPMFTRERLRACHLRDARGPEAAVMMLFKEIAPHDPLRFDDVALPFLGGVTLPPWTQSLPDYPASASAR